MFPEKLTLAQASKKILPFTNPEAHYCVHRTLQWLDSLYFPLPFTIPLSYLRLCIPIAVFHWRWLAKLSTVSRLHTANQMSYPSHCVLRTQRPVLTEDNWCSTVCRPKNQCCSSRRTVPQELDPVHTVPAHQGTHCSINTTAMICSHGWFTTLQLYCISYPLSEVWFVCIVGETVPRYE